MPRRRLTTGTATALAVLAALPGVAAAQAPSPGWQRTDLRPITQPASAAGLFLMYASRGGVLDVVAVDPPTGRTVWTRPASPSDITPGQTPSLLTVGDTVVYLARGLGDSARLTAADARTGATKWQATTGFFTTWPGLCPDTPSAICVSGSDPLGTEAGAMRFDLATGRRLAFARTGDDRGRELGTGLLDPGDRDPERLVSVRGARVAWSRPLARIFPGASTDFGWNIARFGPIGLYVGSVSPRSVRRGARDVLDLSRERTAGFRIADGRVVWRMRGSYACDLAISCPGESRGAREVGADVPTIGVRTVSTGTFSGPANSDEGFVLSRDATARLEGFAPASGRTLWRFDAGRNRALLLGDVPLPQTGPNTIVLTDVRRRLRALDLATGTRSLVAPDAAAWCTRTIAYRQTLGFDAGDVTIHDYAGQQAFTPCAAGTTRRLPTPAAVPAFVRTIGTTAAGLIAWSDTTGLFARPAAP